jgi:hypothetical protein
MAAHSAALLVAQAVPIQPLNHVHVLIIARVEGLYLVRGVIRAIIHAVGFLNPMCMKKFLCENSL